MPMPRVADNPIFQPGSGFFSWQKIIDANKDQSKTAGEEYNKTLKEQASKAAKEQEGAKRGLQAVQTDIDTVKQDVADYVGGGLRGDESAEKRSRIGEVAQKGFQFDANPFQKTLQNVAKTQADLKAARSIAGRMGLQSGQIPNQAALFDQMYLAQGGAGQNADFLESALAKTSEILKDQLGQTSSSAAGLQKEVVPQLADYAQQLQNPAITSAIQKGKEIIGANLAQAKGMANLGAFGDVDQYKDAGVDLNNYIKAPDVNSLSDEELIAYGAPQSNEYQTLQETYRMLGLSPMELPEAKSYALDYNIGDAKSALDLINARKRGGRELGINQMSDEQKRFIEEQKRQEFLKQQEAKKQWEKDTGFAFKDPFEKSKNW